jgi:hypothetical protein
VHHADVAAAEALDLKGGHPNVIGSASAQP